MNYRPPLVGLIGKKRSGKDTFAAGLGYARVAFADPLKDMALDLDPLVGTCPVPGDPSYRNRRLSEVIRALGWEDAKDFCPEVRRTLQYLGTAVRQQDPDFWVRIAMERVQGLRFPLGDEESGEGLPVVVTDVRMKNEAQAIRDAGGVLVRITRPGQAEGDTHVSETDLDGFQADIGVANDGTVKDLRLVARAVAATAHWNALSDARVTPE